MQSNTAQRAKDTWRQIPDVRYQGYNSAQGQPVVTAGGEPHLRGRLNTNGNLQSGAQLQEFGGRGGIPRLNQMSHKKQVLPEEKQKGRQSGKIKILFSLEKNGIVEFYVGGDRRNPKKYAQVINTHIIPQFVNLGDGLNNFILSIAVQDTTLTSTLNYYKGNQHKKIESETGFYSLGEQFWRTRKELADNSQSTFSLIAAEIGNFQWSNSFEWSIVYSNKLFGFDFVRENFLKLTRLHYAYHGEIGSPVAHESRYNEDFRNEGIEVIYYGNELGLSLPSKERYGTNSGVIFGLHPQEGTINGTFSEIHRRIDNLEINGNGGLYSQTLRRDFITDFSYNTAIEPAKPSGNFSASGAIEIGDIRHGEGYPGYTVGKSGTLFDANVWERRTNEIKPKQFLNGVEMNERRIGQSLIKNDLYSIEKLFYKEGDNTNHSTIQIDKSQGSQWLDPIEKRVKNYPIPKKFLENESFKLLGSSYHP
ncbi:MAG: hypothetical protein AB4290_16885 [Spirulina sp.]